MEPPEKFVRECLVGTGPKEDYPVSLDEENLDRPLRGHPGAYVAPVTPRSGVFAPRRGAKTAPPGERSSVFRP